MPTEPTVQKNLRLPYDLCLRLEQLAATTDTTQTDIIVKALESYLQEQQGGKKNEKDQRNV